MSHHEQPQQDENEEQLRVEDEQEMTTETMADDNDGQVADSPQSPSTQQQQEEEEEQEQGMEPEEEQVQEESKESILKNIDFAQQEEHLRVFHEQWTKMASDTKSNKEVQDGGSDGGEMGEATGATAAANIGSDGGKEIQDNDVLKGIIDTIADHGVFWYGYYCPCYVLYLSTRWVMLVYLIIHFSNSIPSVCSKL